MRNRYGDEYRFEKIDDSTYKFVGDTRWCRYGGKENTDKISYNDLGFFDPSGGPFISEGYPIDGRKVKRIFLTDENVCFEVV